MSLTIRPSLLAVATSSEPVGAQPKTDSSQGSTSKDRSAGADSGIGSQIADGVEKAVSGYNFGRIHDLLSNPILHPVPNRDPIPRG